MNPSGESPLTLSAALIPPCLFPSGMLHSQSISVRFQHGKPFRHQPLNPKGIQCWHNLPHCQVSPSPNITITWLSGLLSEFLISTILYQSLVNYVDPIPPETIFIISSASTTANIAKPNGSTTNLVTSGCTPDGKPKTALLSP